MFPGTQQQSVRELQGGRGRGVRPRHHVPQQRHVLQQRLHAEAGCAVQVRAAARQACGRPTRDAPEPWAENQGL